MKTLVERTQARLEKLTKQLSFLGPLLARITLGVVFIGTGWGKLHSLEKVTEFFTNLHLPAPHLQAILVGTTELVGGSLLLVGLGTRLVAAPLAFTMLIAILTAKRDEIDGLSSLLGFEELTYLVMFVWLLLAGAGALSLDRLVWSRLKRHDAGAELPEHGRSPVRATPAHP